MSDPSIVLEHLTNTWMSNRSVLFKYLVEENSLNIIRKKRRFLLTFLFFFILCLLSEEVESQRSQNIFIRTGDVNLLLLFFEYIKDYGWYHRSRHTSPQVVYIHITPQPDRVVEEPPNIQLIIRCIIHQRIQDQTPK